MRTPTLLRTSLASLSLGLALVAHAAPINFDTVGSDLTPVPNGYAGFNWSNFDVSDDRVGSSTGGYQTGVTSGHFVAFNASANPAYLFVPTGSPLIGSFTGNFAASSGSQIVSISGFRSGALVGVQSASIFSSGPTVVSFTFASPVDTLAFGSTAVPFVVDDLTVTPVPEPASFAALGLGALGLTKRRCRA